MKVLQRHLALIGWFSLIFDSFIYLGKNISNPLSNMFARLKYRCMHSSNQISFFYWSNNIDHIELYWHSYFIKNFNKNFRSKETIRNYSERILWRYFQSNCTMYFFQNYRNYRFPDHFSFMNINLVKLVRNCKNIKLV